MLATADITSNAASVHKYHYTPTSYAHQLMNLSPCVTFQATWDQCSSNNDVALPNSALYFRTTTSSDLRLLLWLSGKHHHSIYNYPGAKRFFQHLLDAHRPPWTAEHICSSVSLCINLLLNVPHRTPQREAIPSLSSIATCSDQFNPMDLT